ncbi:MAG: RES family NAD+ phosphorylase [Candidatus Rokubacteria bacterium]|nr:RES family NAD+ phosphorylase [Candidatus Rokubacteria bacterium]
MNLAALPELWPGAPPAASIYHRLVDKEYAQQIDEIAQTVLRSWRYNPRGEFGILYLSSSPACAYREKLKQMFGRKDYLKPQVVGQFGVNLPKCLHLTNSACLAKLAVSREQLADPSDFSVPQSIAREARRIGFEAIIAPSAIGEDCHTLVVFKDRLSPPAQCICDLDSIRDYP